MHLEKRLHHIGGIGTDHDQLAVGHIDHAHQPVGNRQTERGDQQYRPQTDAGKKQPHSLTPGEPAIDEPQAAPGGGP